MVNLNPTAKPGCTQIDAHFVLMELTLVFILMANEPNEGGPTHVYCMFTFVMLADLHLAC